MTTIVLITRRLALEICKDNCVNLTLQAAQHMIDVRIIH